MNLNAISCPFARHPPVAAILIWGWCRPGLLALVSLVLTTPVAGHANQSDLMPYEVSTNGGGETVLVWSRQEVGGGPAAIAWLELAEEGTIQPPRTVELGQPGDRHHPSLSPASNGWAMVWAEPTAVDFERWSVFFSVESGGVWATPQELATAARGVQPKVIVRDSVAYVAVERSAGVEVIGVSLEGRVFQRTLLQNPAGEGGTDPQWVQRKNGDVWLLWTAWVPPPTYNRIYYALASDAGWSAPMHLPTPAGYHPAAYDCHGELHIAYTAPDQGQGRTIGVATYMSGWSIDEGLLGGGGVDCTQPTFAVVDGVHVLAASCKERGNGEPYGLVFRCEYDGDWSVPVRIPDLTTGESSHRPMLLGDSSMLVYATNAARPRMNIHAFRTSGGTGAGAIWVAAASRTVRYVVDHRLRAAGLVVRVLGRDGHGGSSLIYSASVNAAPAGRLHLRDGFDPRFVRVQVYSLLSAKVVAEAEVPFTQPNLKWETPE